METCSICGRVLKSAKQWHYCAKVELDSLFEDKAKQLVFTFDRLLAEIMDWPNVSVSATKNCIVFVRMQTFLIVRPMKKQLDLKFYSSTYTNQPPVYKCVAYSGKFETHIRLSEIEEVDQQVFRLIKKSYEL
jgi:hypothetical protein